MGSALAGCAAAPITPPPVVPPAIIGCTIELNLPDKPEPALRPYFEEGSTGAELADAYEYLKGENQKQAAHIEAVHRSAEDYRRACEDAKNG